MKNKLENNDLTKTPIEAKNIKQINEGLSWAGKLFFAGAAAYIGGEIMKKLKLPIKVRGTPEQIKSMVDTIYTSKKFQEELNKPGASIESVIEKLQIKNITKSNFEKMTKHKWPI